LTPEQLTALGAIATILKTVGTLPIGLILVFVFIGPWVSMAVGVAAIARRSAEETDRVNKSMSIQNDRVNEAMMSFRDQVTGLVGGQEKRFEAVVRMYENNVKVVEDYHGLAQDLTGIITLSTRTLEGLVQKIDNNQFCPMVKEKIGK